MDIHEIIRKRRSIRRFKPDQIPTDVIERIMDSAIWAPSAMNRQMWKFFVLRDEMRDRLAYLHQPLWQVMEPKLLERYGQEGVDLRRDLYVDFANAPVAIACFADKGEFSETTSIISVSLAVENLVLAATAEGLGSLIMGASLQICDEISYLCGVDQSKAQLVLVVLLGYPDENPEPPARRKKRVVYVSSPMDIRNQ